jgi:hypothetical protein
MRRKRHKAAMKIPFELCTVNLACGELDLNSSYQCLSICNELIRLDIPGEA